jgi:CSLREA domain-containing protein
MKIKHLLSTSVLGLGLTLAMLWALRRGPVLAATFSVTQFTDDSGVCNANCSLREAILAANAAPGPDIISLPAGTHSLTITGAGEDNAASGDLDITEALTITGAGPDATVIEASGLADRIFHNPSLDSGSPYSFNKSCSSNCARREPR